MVTKSLEKTRVVNIVYDFFNQFKNWIGPSPITPNAQELEKYLSKNLQMYNNGQLVVKGAAQYLERLQTFQKKYSKFQISQPLEEPIISDNQGVLYYKIDLTTRDGKQKEVYILGKFTIEDDKISHWVEVTNEKGSSTWDSK